MLIFTIVLGGMLLMSFLVYVVLHRNSILFYPTENEIADYSQSLSRYSRLQIQSGKETLAARYYNFSGSNVVLYFHGNAGNMSYYQHVPLVCGELSLDVFMIDYRGFGSSSGQSTISSIYEDGIAAYEYIRQWYRPKQIRIWGDSLGTTVASYVASKKENTNLLLVGAFSSLEDLLLSRQDMGLMATATFITNSLVSFMKALEVEMPTFEWFPNISSSVLLLHSRQDKIVPFRSSDRLLDLNDNAKRMIVEGGHLSFNLTKEQIEEFSTFLLGYQPRKKVLKQLEKKMEKYKNDNPLLNEIL
jgi:pimeloyl-ACP methyl ester carboxylesterase